MVLRELESVLQQVSDRREKHLPVDVESKFAVNIADSKLALPRVRLKGGRYFNVGDEIGEGDQVGSRRHPRCDPHVGE